MDGMRWRDWYLGSWLRFAAFWCLLTAWLTALSGGFEASPVVLAGAVVVCATVTLPFAYVLTNTSFMGGGADGGGFGGDGGG